MPKFGLKCFIGSFLLSLVAIFATTKAYLVMSLNDERKSEPLTHITAQNIDLFASNEEDDPIYEKFNKLNQTQDKVKSNDPAKITVVAENKENKKEDIADILYQPDDNEGIILAENENNNVLPLVEKEDVSQALEENNAISEDESEISHDMMMKTKFKSPMLQRLRSLKFHLCTNTATKKVFLFQMKRMIAKLHWQAIMLHSKIWAQKIKKHKCIMLNFPPL